MEDPGSLETPSETVRASTAIIEDTKSTANAATAKQLRRSSSRTRCSGSTEDAPCSHAFGLDGHPETLEQAQDMGITREAPTVESRASGSSERSPRASVLPGTCGFLSLHVLRFQRRSERRAVLRTGGATPVLMRSASELFTKRNERSPFRDTDSCGRRERAEPSARGSSRKRDPPAQRRAARTRCSPASGGWESARRSAKATAEAEAYRRVRACRRAGA